MLNIAKDIEELLRRTGWSKVMLARHAEISINSLHVLLAKDETSSIIDKLIPFVYGDKRPPDLPAPLPKKPRKKKPSV